MIANAVFIVCIFGALVMAWKIYDTEMEYHKAQKNIQEIYQIAADAGKNLSESALNEEMKTKKGDGEIRTEWAAALHQENPHVIGWIYIPDTVVDYPVMYTPDEPDFYLYRNFKGENSSYGSIYMESSCSLDGKSKNLLLYGHHMRNGDMFGSLTEYADLSYAKEHPVIKFNTLEKSCEYEVIGAFKMSAGEIDETFMAMLQAGTEEQYRKWIDFIEQKQFYDSDVNAQWPDSLITLATCEYTYDDGRFFVVARLKEK